MFLLFYAIVVKFSVVLLLLYFFIFVVFIIIVVVASRHELNFLLRHVSAEKFCMQLATLQHSLTHTHTHPYIQLFVLSVLVCK